MTPINRVQEAFQEDSNCANSSDSNLIIILKDFWDLGVFEGFEIVICIDFN